MPIYHYKAVNEKGKTYKGTFEGDTESALESFLQAQGHWLVETKQSTNKIISNSPKEHRAAAKGDAAISRTALSETFFQWASQLESGITIVQAIENSLEGEKSPKMLALSEGMLKKMREGSNLSEAMKSYPRAFPSLTINMIRAGERSGTLPQVLRDLQTHYEWVERLVSSVRQAALYPMMVSSAAVALVILLFIFVIPRFQQVFIDLGIKLPGLTVAVFGIGEYVKHYGVLTAILIALCIITFKLILKFIPGARFAWDHLKMRMPVFGDVNHKIQISRFAHNLAIMYKSGVPVLDSLTLCRDTMDNAEMQVAVQTIISGVQEGSSLYDRMKEQAIFPLMLTKMVGIGERAGSLESVLERVAAYYDEAVTRRVKKVIALFETAMILGIVGTVGCIALALYLPIVNLMTGLH